MTVYIVMVTDKKMQERSVSQEAYKKYEDAVSFIKKRENDVEWVAPWTYMTESTMYEITDVRVV
ncbi:MAG: hypothetical protein J6Q61_06660 [Bacteroidales bacterium]|nr:hypothetical protein [Bacteroidales bacterium]